MMNNFSSYFSDKLLAPYLLLTQNQNPSRIQTLLNQPRIPLGIKTFALLISPLASAFLEQMAKRSKKITRQRFGNTLYLYAPLYISNECTNTCIYCGFTQENKIVRKSLNKQECLAEAKHLYERGFRDLLIVSGEHQRIVTAKYIGQMVQTCQKFFPSIAIETAPFSQEEYTYLVKMGVQALTLYQETYDQKTYQKVHLAGRKKRFLWRLDALDRGAKAGMRKINLGVLLGLSKNWLYDCIANAYHLEYMMKKYWNIAYGISIPRICESETAYKPQVDISDKQLAQIIFAYRIAFPDLAINLSTREKASLRDGLFELGITHISAESATEPGGYCNPQQQLKQFNTTDKRNLNQILQVLKTKQLEPVWKNWHTGLTGH